MKLVSGNNPISFSAVYAAVTLVMFLTAIVVILNTSLDDSKESVKVGCVIIGAESAALPRVGENVDGLRKACADMGVTLLTREVASAAADACEQETAALIEEGCRMIFFPCRGSADIVGEFAEGYGSVTFCLAGAGESSGNIVYCCGRVYQGRYLEGVVAGQTTKTNVIGYVAAMPCNEVTRSVNAFTLGVRSVNPEATVKVRYTGSWNNEARENSAVSELMLNSADIIAYQLDSRHIADLCDELGVNCLSSREPDAKRSDYLLVSSMCDWRHIYGIVMRDGFSNRCREHGSYWLGINEYGVEMTDISANVSIPTAASYAEASARIVAGADVFSGEIYDNTGVLRCGKDEVLSDRALLNGMDWLVEGALTDE